MKAEFKNSANWNVWRGYHHPSSAKLKKKQTQKNNIEDFLLIGMG